ncbi:MAG: PLDc_N domain-containing protein [Chloroflexi bacterium]|nr:PLDc_N domain-containing protein [Chloroflexota bacterium]
MENSYRLLFIIAILLIWITPMLIALLRLSKRGLDETAKAVWVLAVLILPIIGPLAFLLMSGGNQKK